ncbi:alpha/beta fold hydrolase [Sedimentitalea todarodis]|uniref:Alpha/beta fold hydrolase n=1 Tax=Sedimentitalea todarodis TaxID=1631240 RepID=A0ABU3VLN3_9RHOB|nr:alpha/beta fold hydrolase [Sedimentitalea todarodis]MDU9007099.1 alpha/beta fold hydrolase [Sedimentitalea todarodis]
MKSFSLHITLLGELSVSADGKPVNLPASRKARAVLGYLAATGRPIRRERLCELFWDMPDDPRGSLRWALSKLRQVVDQGGVRRIVADRERVTLALDDTHVELRHIWVRLNDDPPLIPPPELREMAELLERSFLEGLEYAGTESFQQWLASERENVRLMHLNVLRRLALHPELTQAETVKWARLWQEATPVEEESARGLVIALAQSGRLEEARQSEAEFHAAAKEAGLPAAGSLLPDLLETPEIDPSVERPGESAQHRQLRKQKIGFCRASDGARIAYATVGEGPPLVKAANWLNHLELDWNSPIWGSTFSACSEFRKFIRYDERGNGLSDWDVNDISMEAFVRDLETVVDALELKRFPLLGISQGCAVSVEYAVRHPERVTGLVLIAGYATGWRIGASAEEQAHREAVLTLTRHGWGTSNPAYRHIFSQTFMPDSKPEDLDWFDEFQRQTTSPENAVRFQEAFGDIDVRDSLAKVNVPTIVFHARGDRRISVDQGRELAMGIPGAEFVPLDSENHIMLGHEPAWRECILRTREFMKEHWI